MPKPKQTNKQITLLETHSKRNNYIPHAICPPTHPKFTIQENYALLPW